VVAKLLRALRAKERMPRSLVVMWAETVGLFAGAVVGWLDGFGSSGVWFASIVGWLDGFGAGSAVAGWLDGFGAGSAVAGWLDVVVAAAFLSLKSSARF